MGRMTKTERRGRDLIARERVPGLPILRLGYGLGASFKLAIESDDDRHASLPPKKVTVLQLCRKIVGSTDTADVYSAIPIDAALLAARQIEVVQAALSLGGITNLESRVAEIIDSQQLPPAAEITFETIEEGPKPKWFYIGRVSMDSTLTNLEWINPLRVGLGMNPLPITERLRAPIHHEQHVPPRSSQALRETVAGVSLPLGPIVTSDTSIVPVYTR